MRRTALRHPSVANGIRAEISRLRIAIRHELRTAGGASGRMQTLQSRKARLADQLVALEIDAFAATWR